MQAKRNYTHEQISNLREISDSFWANTGASEGQIINKEFFFQVFLALILSIPGMDFFEIQEKYSEKPEMPPKKEENDPKKRKNGAQEEEEKPENPENELKNLFYALTKVSDKGTKSKLLLQRTEAKSRYYEECYAIRVIIQNFDYNFCGLGASTSNFLQGREFTKVQKDQIKTYGIGPEKCLGCSTKWLHEKYGKCLRCENDNSINFFVSMCCYFQVLGDNERFWLFLDPVINQKIADHGEEIKEFFRSTRTNFNRKRWNELRKEYGEKQLSKIVKEGGVDYVDSKPDFKEFNRKYDLALLEGMKELDLREAKNATKEEFCEELSMLNFPYVKKIIFPQRKININAFKPNMGNLEILIARGCQIKQIELDPEYFFNLYTIDLEYNEIEEFLDFRNLTRIQSLKFIKIAENPIEYKDEIYDAQRILFNSYKIELQFSINRMYHRKKIEEESDEEIRSAMRAKGEDSQSELSQRAKDSLINKK